MPADIVNLRKARKAKARREKEILAAANRAKFGRTKAERQRAEADTARMRSALESHRRDKDDGEPTP